LNIDVTFEVSNEVGFGDLDNLMPVHSIFNGVLIIGVL